ncbi:MAG: phosphate ABC transporter substrate-binding protein PstS [Pseudomonadota bacterium]
MKRFSSFLLLVGFLVFGISAVSLAGDMELLGAGATFPNPLYSKMFYEYFNEFKTKVNYQGIGSGGGIKQLSSKVVDFGGTDAFMTEDQLKAAGAPILHVPTCLGSVVISYNLPDNPKLKFTPDVIADIFLGKIKKWNDPRITVLNQGVHLPDLAISVTHRSDGSGTTNIFSDYLCKVSPEWKQKVGMGTSLNWPVGLGGKGNPGVAGMVKQIPGSIGYVELIYTLQNNMPAAALKNKAGKFIEPTIKSTSAAANIKLPDDTHVSLTNTEAAEGYPIAGFTWLIFYKEQNYGGRTLEKAEALAKLIQWVITGGQRYAESLHYAPLSKDALAKAEKIVHSMTYNGKPVLK